MKTKNLTFKLLKLFQLAYIFTKEKYKTKQNKKLWSETIFETFSVSFILIIFSISGTIPQIDEFTDR